jgi:hypothetical protein
LIADALRKMVSEIERPTTRRARPDVVTSH